jgi:hypothetical protein
MSEVVHQGIAVWWMLDPLIPSMCVLRAIAVMCGGEMLNNNMSMWDAMRMVLAKWWWT